MAMKQEQFDTLVKRLEVVARKQPGSYRFQVGLLAVLGYVYILLVLTGLLGLMALLVWIVVASHRINLGLIKFGLVLLVLVFVILRSLWVSFPPPQGLELKRPEVPRLFALVDELTDKLQAPRFHHILLDRQFNAAVVQVPRLGIFGWQRNYLLVGLPLMQALSLEQFKAVLAHELGHLSGNHSRFSGWIYRVRQTWMQIFERLHQSDSGHSSFLFDGFFNWYAPFFSAYSFVLARMNEYEADRCAVQLAGAKATAAALINVAITARWENAFWEDMYQQVKTEPDPPATAYTAMMTALPQANSHRDHSCWLDQALAQKTSNDDTHPCLSDRLQALGYQFTKQDVMVPEPTTVSAAEALLGNDLRQYAVAFGHEWKEKVATPWRQKFAYLEEARTRLQALEEWSKIEPLSLESSWERASLTLEVQGNAAAMPLLQEILADHPEHLPANYLLGQVLLKQENSAGVKYIERAIDGNPEWVIEGCQLIYSFFGQRGEEAAANAYRDRIEAHYQRLSLARQERSTVSDRDAFRPHTFEAAEVEAIKQQVAEIPQVKEAYLVEKVVTHFPQWRCCVLGIVRKQGFIESEEAAPKLVATLVNTVQLPVEGFIVILNHSGNGRLKQVIPGVERSLIFRRSK